MRGRTTGQSLPILYFVEYHPLKYSPNDFEQTPSFYTEKKKKFLSPFKPQDPHTNSPD